MKKSSMILSILLLMFCCFCFVACENIDLEPKHAHHNTENLIGSEIDGQQNDKGEESDQSLATEEEITNSSACFLFEYLEETDSYSAELTYTNYNSDVVVPSVYLGKPVTQIVQTEEIVYPDDSYFCGKVRSFTIPASIRLLDVQTGINTRYLYYEGDIASWCGIEIKNRLYGDLYVAGELICGKDLLIPDNVREIKSNTFCGQRIKNLIIKGGVQVDSQAFSSSIVANLKIEDGAILLGSPFSNCRIGRLEVGKINHIDLFATSIIECVDKTERSFIQEYFLFWGEPECYSKEDFDSKLIIEGDYVFYDNRNNLAMYLGNDEQIDIPNNVENIYTGVFSGNLWIKEIHVPRSVTSIGRAAFSNCLELKKISFEKGINLAIINEHTFSTCRNMQSIVIPASVKTIGSEAFLECTGLREVVFEESSQLTNIYDAAFVLCTKLKSITIPEKVTYIQSEAFLGCTLIEVYNKSTLPIEKGSEENGSVALYAKEIYTKEYTTKMEFDESGFIYYVDSDSKELIGYLGEKNEITIPSDISEIAPYTFSSCFSISTVLIPKNVQKIGTKAFSYCYNLKSIRYEGTKAQWNMIAKGEDWSGYTGTVHCEDGDIQESSNDNE